MSSSSSSAPVMVGVLEKYTEIGDYTLLDVAGYAEGEIVYHVRYLQNLQIVDRTHESWLLKIKDDMAGSSVRELVRWYHGNKDHVEVGEKIIARGRICIPIKACKYGSLRKVLHGLHRKRLHGMPERHIIFILKNLLKALIAYEETYSFHGQLTAGHIFIDHDDEERLKVKIAADDAIFEDYRGVTRNELGRLRLPDSARLWDQMVPPEQNLGSSGCKLSMDMWMLGIIALELGVVGFPPEFNEDKMRSYINEFRKSVKANKGIRCWMPSSSKSALISLPIAEVDRFSPELKSFIAKCLKNEESRRPTPKKILNKKNTGRIALLHKSLLAIVYKLNRLLKVFFDYN